MNVKNFKTIGIIILVIIALFIFTGNGQAAAGILQSMLGWIPGAITSIVVFVKTLFGK